MSWPFRNLKRFEQGIRITLPTDETGMVGRECPKGDCLGYFKVRFGTGLKGENLPCHCPYCGYTASHNQFYTQDQLEYAQSVLLNEVQPALKSHLEAWGRDLQRTTRDSFLKIDVTFKGQPVPVHRYRERQLETAVTCEQCTLEYAVYGVFAFCPDCGAHNSLQILVKNMELVEKQIKLADSMTDRELAERLIQGALGDAISKFDGFGRGTCAAFAQKASNPEDAATLSFQNIDGARSRVRDLFGFDFADGLTPGEMDFVIRCFQKRHLLAHRMGVIDEGYVKKTQDPQAIAGRKVTIEPQEILDLTRLLKAVGSRLSAGVK